MPALIDAICAIGERLRLPYIAAQSDPGDPEPMSDRQGQPYAVTHFRWIDPEHAYWQDRKLALHSPFLTATRAIATHVEARQDMRPPAVPQALTRREVQCLRWAAAGKTDHEIGSILALSMSTVRFHLRNASGKLGGTGRAQSIQIAAGLGYIGGPSG